MNEEEKKADKLVNSLKEWGKIHFIVKDRCHAKLTYNEVYLLLALIEKLQKENEEWDRKFCNLQNLYFKLQDESESKRKEYQETYKDVREELRELRKEDTEQKELIEKMRVFLLKDNKMCEFLESEE